jgi:glycine/D-amino acid oxidase-like deaminating enzyme
VARAVAFDDRAAGGERARRAADSDSRLRRRDALTLAAARAAQKYGATFVTETGAIRIFSDDGRVGVRSASQTWEADRVVLAAAAGRR